MTAFSHVDKCFSCRVRVGADSVYYIHCTRPSRIGRYVLVFNGMSRLCLRIHILDHTVSIAYTHTLTRPKGFMKVNSKTICTLDALVTQCFVLLGFRLSGLHGMLGFCCFREFSYASYVDNDCKLLFMHRKLKNLTKIAIKSFNDDI